MAAEGGRVGNGLAQRHIDRLQHASKVTIHIAIPKSENSKAEWVQFLVAARITSDACIEIVLPAIDLNDKAVFHTNRINNAIFAR